MAHFSFGFLILLIRFRSNWPINPQNCRTPFYLGFSLKLAFVIWHVWPILLTDDSSETPVPDFSVSAAACQSLLVFSESFIGYSLFRSMFVVTDPRTDPLTLGVTLTGHSQTHSLWLSDLGRPEAEPPTGTHRSTHRFRSLKASIQVRWLFE